MKDTQRDRHDHNDQHGRHAIPAIHARVSHRDFTGDPIPADMLEEILLSGTKAPTGGNMQPWEFVIIESQEAKVQIAQTTFSGYFSQGTNYQRWIENAGVIIVTCANQRRTGARYGRPGHDWALMDVAAAIENMLLTITELGLSCCWVGGFREPELKNILGIPSYVKPVGLLPIGFPSTPPPAPKSRLSLKWITHRDAYDKPYFPL